MLAEHEWRGFASVCKGLRVSRPKGEQRSTFYLQLPLRYGLPLVVASSLLHWLVSQSLFFVRILIFPSEGGTYEEATSVTSCGYSPIAIFFVILTGCTMLVGMLILGWKRYPLGMPLAGSCSAIISAACHPPVRPKVYTSDEEGSKRKKGTRVSVEGGAKVRERVMWGWVEGDDYDNHDDGDDCGDESDRTDGDSITKAKSKCSSWNEKQKEIDSRPLAVRAKRGRFTFSTGAVEKFDPLDPTKRKIVTSRVDSFKMGKKWTRMKDLDLGDSPV